MAPFISGTKRNYIFGGICNIAANAAIKVCMMDYCLKKLGLEVAVFVELCL